MRDRDPPGLGDRGLLPYYARHFDFVEINTTFYRMPTAGMLATWGDQTPEGFAFVIKAPRLFTHERCLAYVCVDEPQFKTLVPPVIHATADFAYVRLHGRNYKKWWVHEKPEERYDYLYSEAELAEWVPRLRTLERAAGRVFASMNNHRGGQATINGRMLKELLELGRAVTPAGCSTASSPGPA